jgi:phage tail-like protein
VASSFASVQSPNDNPDLDPCRVQPGVALAAFLLANATPTEEGVFLDCFVERDFSLRDLFPRKVLAEDDARDDGWLGRLLDAFDPEMGAAFNRVDCFPTIIDPLRCPSHLLDHLLYHYGNPFTLEEGMTDTEKRRLLSVLFTIYSFKGTCPGMIGAIRMLYGISVTECVAANVECWVLGESELDIDTILCPSTLFEKYAFQVMVDVNLTARQRLQMTNIVNYMRPANTHFIGFIEPGHPDFIDHWLLDFSLLNINTDLH